MLSDIACYHLHGNVALSTLYPVSLTQRPGGCTVTHLGSYSLQSWTFWPSLLPISTKPPPFGTRNIIGRFPSTMRDLIVIHEQSLQSALSLASEIVRPALREPQVRPRAQAQAHLIATAWLSPSTINIALSRPVGFPSVVSVCLGVENMIGFFSRCVDPGHNDTTAPLPPVCQACQGEITHHSLELC